MSEKLTFAVRTRTHEPLSCGDTTLVTEAQAITIPWPGGGRVWNRPTAVYVYRNGTAERLPIVDVTRQALIALGVATAVLTTLIAILSKPANRIE